MLIIVNLLERMSSLVVENPRSRIPEGLTVDPVSAAHMANSFLRTALDQASEGIMIVAPAFQPHLGPRILLHNTRMAALVGAEPSRGLCDRFLTQLAATEEEAGDLLRVLRCTVKQGGAAQWEGGMKTFSETRWCAASGASVRSWMSTAACTTIHSL